MSTFVSSILNTVGSAVGYNTEIEVQPLDRLEKMKDQLQGTNIGRLIEIARGNGKITNENFVPIEDCGDSGTGYIYCQIKEGKDFAWTIDKDGRIALGIRLAELYHPDKQWEITIFQRYHDCFNKLTRTFPRTETSEESRLFTTIFPKMNDFDTISERLDRLTSNNLVEIEEMDFDDNTIKYFYCSANNRENLLREVEIEKQPEENLNQQ